MATQDIEYFVDAALEIQVVKVPAAKRQQVSGFSRYYEPETGRIKPANGLGWNREACAGGELPERWFEVLPGGGLLVSLAVIAESAPSRPVVVVGRLEDVVAGGG